MAARIDLAILKKFGTAAPRYASYPTADRFVEAFGAEEHASWLNKRSIGGFGRALGLYIHAPYYDASCAFCGQRKSVTTDRAAWSRYLKYVGKEAHLKSGFLNDHSVVAIHWGRNIPISLANAEFRDLEAMLAQRFTQSETTVRCIEVDPGNVDDDSISTLCDLAFDRILLGSRSYGASAQIEPHHEQISNATESIARAVRQSGIGSVTFELAYGLPEQTLKSFERDLQKTIELSPERVIVYDFSRLRYLSRARGKIKPDQLPDTDSRLQQYRLAATRLIQSGYIYIGMDCFTKPDDELAVAQRQGRLHRNFQGYLTHADCDLLGLGVSSFSMVGPSYSQNARALDDYYERLDNGLLPVVRGVELTPDDLARRTVMQALMCHFEIAFESMEIAHMVDFKAYFADEVEDLKIFVDAGLVQIDDSWLCVTDRGRFVVAAICMVFDRYSREGRHSASCSKVL